jgi:hypothetical protein
VIGALFGILVFTLPISLLIGTLVGPGGSGDSDHGRRHEQPVSG